MKAKSDLQWNIELRQSHRKVLEAIVRELDGIDPAEWSKAEQNIYRLAYAELQK